MSLTSILYPHHSIITAFTIEPHNPEFGDANQDVDEPIEGIMTTVGYILPYPKQNRFSVWFTGGSLEIKSKTRKCCRYLFNSVSPRTFSEKSKLFVAKLLMGATMNDQMDENGKLSYQLTRPMAAYIDLLFMNESLRVMRSSSGVIYVFSRVQDSDDLSSIDSTESNDSFSSCDTTTSPANKRINMENAVRPVRRGSSPSLPSVDTPRRPTRCPSPPTCQQCPRRPVRQKSPSRAVPM